MTKRLILRTMLTCLCVTVSVTAIALFLGIAANSEVIAKSRETAYPDSQTGETIVRGLNEKLVEFDLGNRGAEDSDGRFVFVKIQPAIRLSKKANVNVRNVVI